MKQFVIDQMKEYQRKKEIVKAIKYQEGMEDGWMVEYPEYRDDCEIPIMMREDKLFRTKSEAENYIEGANPIPVILTEISEEDYQDTCFTLENDGKYYMYEEVGEGYWIILDENGYISTAYDTEDFFDEYESISNKSISKEQTCVKIGYDRDLEELYMEYSGISRINISIDKSEVATVEKVLDALKIPYTEKLGEYLLWID